MYNIKFARLLLFMNWIWYFQEPGTIGNAAGL
jgi:hypothetical protein